MNREAIYQALFALGQGMTWGAGKTFAFTSRRVKLFSDLPSWPALCQAEHDETVVSATNMPDKITLGAVWLLYHNVGKDTSPGVVPATESNAMLDAVDGLFPTDDTGFHQTLGGLVHNAQVSGKIIKEHGDIDGQALLIIPLRLIVPN